MPSIELILAHLEREAAKLRTRAVHETHRAIPSTLFPMGLVNTDGIRWKPLVMQTPFGLRGDRRYHINDLLACHGDDFIRSAYLALLGREPDAQGAGYYREMLLQGQDKGIILARIAFSREARAVQSTIIGVGWYKIRAVISMIPVLGSAFDWLRAVMSLHKVGRRLNTIEAHWTIQDQHIASHLNSNFTSNQD